MMDRIFKRFAEVFWNELQDRVDRDIMSHAQSLGAERLDRAMKAVDNPKPFQEEDVDKFERRMAALTPIFKRFVKKIDTVMDFVTDECVLLEHEKIESRFLYRCYCAWCFNNALTPFSKSVFRKRLLGHFPASVEYRASKYSFGYFMGITIAEKEG